MYNQISKRERGTRLSGMSRFFPLCYQNDVLSPSGQSIYFGNLLTYFKEVKNNLSEKAQRAHEIIDFRNFISMEWNLLYGTDGFIDEVIKLDDEFYKRHPDLHAMITGVACLKATLSDKLDQKEIILECRKRIQSMNFEDPSPIRDYRKTAELSSRSPSKKSSG